MKIFTEKEAENFLKKNDFEIFKGIYFRHENELKKVLENFKFPVVIKISGKKIIHKKRLGGVVVGVSGFERAKYIFKKFIQIKDVEEVLIQEQINGKEFFLGIKKTPEFEHVLIFGKGGTDVEEKKEVVFRVCSVLEKKDIKKMFKELKIKKNSCLEKNIFKLCELIKKFPEILELDINPFILQKNGFGKIADARIVWE